MRLTYVQLVHLWKSQFSRSTEPIKRRCSRNKTETTGSAINACKRHRWFVCQIERRTRNKIRSDVSLPVNCRCEVCVRSPTDLARKAGGVAGLADFEVARRDAICPGRVLILRVLDSPAAKCLSIRRSCSGGATPFSQDPFKPERRFALGPAGLHLASISISKPLRLDVVFVEDVHSDRTSYRLQRTHDYAVRFHCIDSLLLCSIPYGCAAVASRLYA